MLKISSKISISVFLIALAGLSVYGFFFFRDRYAAPKKVDSKQASDIEPSFSDQSSQTTDDATSADSTADNSAADLIEGISNEGVEIEDNNFLDVSKDDCKNDCKDFTDPTDLKYCRDICGLTPTKKDIKEKKGCDALADLEKDYCLKDLAINTKNIEVCTQIVDTNVMKTCRNRVAEDLIEKQMSL